MKTTLTRIEFNCEYKGSELGAVKKFWVKFPIPNVLPDYHKYTFLLGTSLIAKSSHLIYDETRQMWELQFFRRLSICVIFHLNFRIF